MADPSVDRVVVLRDLYWAEEDWQGYDIPVRVLRNVTISGHNTSDDSRDSWPLLDTGTASRKLQLGNGVVMQFRNVVIRNVGRTFQALAPGLNILAPCIPGEVAMMRSVYSVIVSRFCFTPQTFSKFAEQTQRPPQCPGAQLVRAGLSQAGCVNVSRGGGAASPSVPMQRWCAASMGMYDDAAVWSMDMDPVQQRQDATGIAICITTTSFLCLNELSDACLAKRGPLGCVQAAVADLSAALAIGDERATLPSTSVGSSLSPPPGLGVGRSGSVASYDSDASGGGSSSGDGSRVLLGALLGGLLGSLALLAGAVILVMVRRRRRRGASGGGSGSCPSNPQQVIPPFELEGGSGHQPRVYVMCDAMLGTDPRVADTAPAKGSSSCSSGGGRYSGEEEDEENEEEEKEKNEDGSKRRTVVVNTSSAITRDTADASDGPPPVDPFVVVTPLTPPRPGLELGLAPGNEVRLLKHVLGAGSYGKVVVGEYRAERVAVKLMRDCNWALWGLGNAAIIAASKSATNAAAVSTGTAAAAAAPATGTAPTKADPVSNSTTFHTAFGTANAAQGQVADGTSASHPVMNDHVRQYVIKTLAQEVEILGRCDHPNVVRLLAACLAPPRVCLVTELMDTSLEGLLYDKPGELLPMALVLDIALDVASGLEYLHPTIVHRDLKPGNVLIKLPGPGCNRLVAKLTDFGFSRMQYGTVQTLNPEVGTPQYMAPELFDLNYSDVHHLSDMYSFGVLMWALLTGRRPWEGVDIISIAHRVSLMQQRLQLAEIPPDRRHESLIRLIGGCWEPEPRRRPAAAEAAKELRRLRWELQEGGQGQAAAEFVG